jgi:hypothetical protein
MFRLYTVLMAVAAAFMTVNIALADTPLLVP